MNPKVDFFFDKAAKWKEELQLLRTIILDCQLNEELKWGCPCYIFEGRNIVLIHAFKDYCALLFFKGALMKDPKKILIQQTENVQSARQIRFTSLAEVKMLTPSVKAYVFEAVKVEESGQKVAFRQKQELVYPEEFQKVINSNAALKTAFEALTPGRQRAYNLFFSQPKQSKTREARVEKSIPAIMEGKGLND